MENNRQTFSQPGGRPNNYHLYFNILLPLAYSVEDYGYYVNFNGENMYIMDCPTGQNYLRLVILVDDSLQLSDNITTHHISCYIDNNLIFTWTDFISDDRLTRVIGDITVRMIDDLVLWNKFY